MKAGVHDWAPENWPNKKVRLQRLFEALMDDDDDDAASGALELARDCMARGFGRGSFDRGARWLPELEGALAADGWEYDPESERLVSVIPGVAVVEETLLLERELDDRGWEVAAGHYRQAVDCFSRGKWAAANSQVRSLLEALLPLAAAVEGKMPPKNPQAALDRLQKRSFLHKGEYGFAKGLWELAQTRGSHPGLSDEAEARFRLMAATAYCRFVVERLPET